MGQKNTSRKEALEIAQVSQDQTLLAKFHAVISQFLHSADLPFLRFLASEKIATGIQDQNGQISLKESDNPRVLLPKNEEVNSFRIEEFDAFQKTEWLKISSWLDKQLKKHRREIQLTFDIDAIESGDPAVIASLCVFLLSKNFVYWYDLRDFNKEMLQHLPFYFKEMSPELKQRAKDMADIDRVPWHKLFEREELICRHFTKMVIALFRVFQSRDNTGNLRNTEFYENVLYRNELLESSHVFSETEAHVWLLMVNAQEEKLTISVFDPTHTMSYIEYDPRFTAEQLRHFKVKSESFNFNRLPFAIDFLTNDRMWQVTSKYFGSRKDLLSLINTAIKDMEKVLLSYDKDNKNPLYKKDRHQIINVIAGYYQLAEKLSKEESTPSLTSMLIGYNKAFARLIQNAEKKQKTDKSVFWLKEPMFLGMAAMINMYPFRQPDSYLKAVKVVEERVYRFGTPENQKDFYDLVVSAYSSLLLVLNNPHSELFDHIIDAHHTLANHLLSIIEKEKQKKAK